jgi:hypothetical protein
MGRGGGDKARRRVSHPNREVGVLQGRRRHKLDKVIGVFLAVVAVLGDSSEDVR